MACFSPLPALPGNFNFKTGKCKPQIFRRTEFNLAKYSMRIPCQKCCGCRLDYSREWAVRCVHEASMYEENSFITLTYNNKFLPRHGSLDYGHWTDFMKRFREEIVLPYAKPFVDSGFKKKEAIKLAREVAPKIRFYMGPEYSDKGRPHYHALIFGYQFPDLELHSIRNGIKLYTSEILAKLWSCPVLKEPYGFVTVGDVTFESAAYVARYMMKKVKGEDHLLRYFSRDEEGRPFVSEDGELFPIAPEKARMSNRDGIGKKWFDLYQGEHEQVYPNDFVVIDGRKCRPPKYYDRIYEKISPEDYERIREARVSDAEVYAEHRTEERLAVRKVVLESKLSRLVRDLE